MEEKLAQLCKENDVKGITQAIRSLKSSKILQLLKDFLLHGREEVVILLKGILEGLDTDVTENVKKRLEIYTQVFTVVNDDDVSTKISDEVIGLLLMEVDSFPGKALVEMSDFIIDAIKAGKISNCKPLELFPKILTNISNLESVPFKTDGEMRGTEYRSQTINTLCSSSCGQNHTVTIEYRPNAGNTGSLWWDPKVVVHLATMFRDIQMNLEELSFVVSKIIRMFKDIDLQEIPPLVYQLLLLASKGHKRHILDGICLFFNEKDKVAYEEGSPLMEDENDSRLRPTEGTVILHMMFAMKQDQDLGRDFLKYLKASQQGKEGESLTAFNIALALSVSTIHRLEEGIFEFLKSTILKCFKEDERRKNSKWVKELFPNSCEVEKSILLTVQNSKHGWDHVVQGLVQLGLTLMDCFIPKQNELFDIKCPKSPVQRACSLGAKILEEMFKCHDFLREEILGQILNVIAARASQNATNYIVPARVILLWKGAPKLCIDGHLVPVRVPAKAT